MALYKVKFGDNHYLYTVHKKWFPKGFHVLIPPYHIKKVKSVTKINKPTMLQKFDAVGE